MKLAENYMAKHILEIIRDNKANCEPELQEVLTQYEGVKGQREEERKLYDQLVSLLETSKCEGIKPLLDMKGDIGYKITMDYRWRWLGIRHRIWWS